MALERCGYAVLTVMVATPITRPSSRASILNVLLSRSAASALSLTVRAVRVVAAAFGEEAGALRWQGQTARATRGRDLQLNVPFPRKPPDLLMAESPPTGGLSAFNRPAGDPGAAPLQPSHAGPPSSMLLEATRSLPGRGAV